MNKLILKHQLKDGKGTGKLSLIPETEWGKWYRLRKTYDAGDLFKGKKEIVVRPRRTGLYRWVTAQTKLLLPSELMYPFSLVGKAIDKVPGGTWFNLNVAPVLILGNYASALHEGSLNPYRGAELRANDERLLGAYLPFDFFGPSALDKGAKGTFNGAVNIAAKHGNKTALAYKVSRAINEGVKDYDGTTFVAPTSNVRTKLGDVEVDNPQLAYRQVGVGGGQNFLETGYAFTPLETLNMLNFRNGTFLPTMRLKMGLDPGWTTMRPMYSQGKLWFEPGEGDLITTAQPLRYGNSKGGITNSATKAGTRRISDYRGEVTPENASVYTWQPNYGYRQIRTQPTTYNHPGTFLNLEDAIGPLRRSYERPDTRLRSYEFELLSNTKGVGGKTTITEKPLFDLSNSRVLIKGNKLRTGRLFEDILESDIPLLREMFNSEKYTEMTVPGSGQKVKMFILGNKQPIRYDVLEKLLQENDPALKAFEKEYNNPILTETGKTELNKAKAKYKKISDTYENGLLELKQQTKMDYGSEVNWDWYNGGILSLSNIPAKVAVSPVYDPRFGRAIDLRPMMLRFYENVLDKDGIIQKTQKYLIDHKIIEPWEGKWLYLPKGKNYKEIVDPTRFILNWILENELKSTNKINFVRDLEKLGLTFIPYHSTPIGDATLYRQFVNTGRRPLFASIDDDMPGFYPLKRAYQKTKFGTSIPVMRKIAPIEIDKLISENGLHSSNNFGDVGELMNHFLSNGGRAREVQNVSDARNIKGNTGQRQNEYNYGTGTPDIGFLLNTFDLELPSSVVGPFLGYKKGGKM